jgi:FdhE protein
VSGLQRDNATYGLDDIVARLEGLIGRPHVSAQYVSFRIDLLKAQWTVREALAGVPSRTRESAGAAVPVGVRPGDDAAPPRPALDANGIHFDPNLLEFLFQAICDSTVRQGGQSEDIRILATEVRADPGLLDNLARRATSGPDMEGLESLARRLRVLPDVLLFVGRALAAPFFAEAARWVAGQPQATGVPPRISGRCGLCGSPPAIATLRREDGRRILTCGLCGAPWEFARLGCPWCETQDPGALTLLRLSPEDPRWVEACEACRGYIKTVDERRLPLGESIIPVVEEASTLHLDLLAEREGFIRRLPYALSG